METRAAAARVLRHSTADRSQHGVSLMSGQADQNVASTSGHKNISASTVGQDVSVTNIDQNISASVMGQDVSSNVTTSSVASISVPCSSVRKYKLSSSAKGRDVGSLVREPVEFDVVDDDLEVSPGLNPKKVVRAAYHEKLSVSPPPDTDCSNPESSDASFSDREGSLSLEVSTRRLKSVTTSTLPRFARTRRPRRAPRNLFRECFLLVRLLFVLFSVYVAVMGLPPVSPTADSASETNYTWIPCAEAGLIPNRFSGKKVAIVPNSKLILRYVVGNGSRSTGLIDQPSRITTGYSWESVGFTTEPTPWNSESDVSRIFEPVSVKSTNVDGGEAGVEISFSKNSTASPAPGLETTTDKNGTASPSPPPSENSNATTIPVAVVSIVAIVVFLVIVVVYIRRRYRSVDLNNNDQNAVAMSSLLSGPRHHSNCESHFHKSRPTKVTLHDVQGLDGRKRLCGVCYRLSLSALAHGYRESEVTDYELASRHILELYLRVYTAPVADGCARQIPLTHRDAIDRFSDLLDQVYGGTSLERARRLRIMSSVLATPQLKMKKTCVPPPVSTPTTGANINNDSVQTAGTGHLSSSKVEDESSLHLSAFFSTVGDSVVCEDVDDGAGAVSSHYYSIVDEVPLQEDTQHSTVRGRVKSGVMQRTSRISNWPGPAFNGLLSTSPVKTVDYATDGAVSEQDLLDIKTSPDSDIVTAANIKKKKFAFISAMLEQDVPGIKTSIDDSVMPAADRRKKRYRTSVLEQTMPGAKISIGHAGKFSPKSRDMDSVVEGL